MINNMAMYYKFTINAQAVKDHPAPYGEKITNSTELAAIARPLFEDVQNVKERMVAFYLNQANRITGYYIVSEGTTKETLVDVKSTLFHAVNTLAQSVVLVHNHPSGTNQPSAADREQTIKVHNALSLVDCALLDHIILTDNGYFSFNDEGLI